MSHNQKFKRKFDSIASNYEDISNNYTIKRRAEFSKILSDQLILEVGSGTGIVSELIDKNIICSDISFQMCKQSVKKNRKNVICCDAEKLPFRDNVLDAILSAEMIYYLNDVDNFIECSYSCLKNNSEITITMFNQKMKFIDKFRAFLRIFDKNQYFDDGQRDFLSIKNLKKFLQKNQFEIISIEKRVLLPFNFFHKINLLLENTFLSYFCYFIIIRAKCTK
jgi:ubiquinone/menaquinone biosynthesis C-methylase UbiE